MTAVVATASEPVVSPLDSPDVARQKVSAWLDATLASPPLGRFEGRPGAGLARRSLSRRPGDAGLGHRARWPRPLRRVRPGGQLRAPRSRGAHALQLGHRAHGRRGPDDPGHRGAAATAAPALGLAPGGVVSAVQRGRCRFRSGFAGLPGRSGRRQLGGQRAEGLVVVRRRCLAGIAPGARPILRSRSSRASPPSPST